jgi:hypothetical protein
MALFGELGDNGLSGCSKVVQIFVAKRAVSKLEEERRRLLANSERAKQLGTESLTTSV